MLRMDGTIISIISQIASSRRSREDKEPKDENNTYKENDKPTGYGLKKFNLNNKMPK